MQTKPKPKRPRIYKLKETKVVLVESTYWRRKRGIEKGKGNDEE